MAKARLKAADDSVSFSERELLLSNGPVKVGRSVGDLKPAPHNAYFHCKVLSRNHALLWYDTAQRRFFVRDTKSSNGTFVNKQKIGPLDDGSECAPFEIFSGDVIQFGVEVQEATKKDKDGNPVTVTHGCIITHMKLINPDGSEYLPPVSALDQKHLQNVIATQDLYILNKYLKEAKEREIEVEKKLSSFLDVIQQLEKQSENGCDNVIREDYLLSKIEILEAQVNACVAINSASDFLGGEASSSSSSAAQKHATSRDDNDDNTPAHDDDDAVTIAGQVEADLQEKLTNSVVNVQRVKLDELNNIKALYEQGAKEYLNRAMLEKMSALDHVAQVENELGKCQSECEYLKNNCLAVEAALKDLIQRHQDQLERSTQLLGELKDAEQSKQQLVADAERDKRDLEARIDDANSKVETLSAQVSEAVDESTQLKDYVADVEAMRAELLGELEQYRRREFCDEAAQTDLTLAAGDESRRLVVVAADNESASADQLSLSAIADESGPTGSNGSGTPSLLDRITGLLSNSTGNEAADTSSTSTHDTFNKSANSKLSDVLHGNERSTSSPSPSSRLIHATPPQHQSNTPSRGMRDAPSSGRKSADGGSSNIREQQSVEQFLSSVSDSPGNATIDTTKLAIATFRDAESSPISFADAERMRDLSPVPPPPPRDTYTRQDTLTEVRAASTIPAEELEERLQKVEACISALRYNDNDIAIPSSSGRSKPTARRSGEMPYAVEIILAMFAVGVMLLSWLWFDG